ncbi:hypothetical protein TgHK011_003260 [Trichoderma gracile]|nr:hypothetical protein TgHK011_003260 [Trichoderma gracile]
MRLLEIGQNGELEFTRRFTGGSIPQYAILSHTWGPDDEEVVFKDVENGTGMNKAGYDKIRFCANQASRDGLKYFWVDSCCIDKSDSVELSEAINSMFRWYSNAARCYVYLSDVSIAAHEQDDDDLPPQYKCGREFKESRWFTRSWTLQELLAPKTVEFFTKEGWMLGNKGLLAETIHESTGIAIPALLGQPLSTFPTEERMGWAEKRSSTREEDWAYSLLGIFGVFMPLIYGEGKSNATRRLKAELNDTTNREDTFHLLQGAGGLAKIWEATRPFSIPPPGVEAVDDPSVVFFRRQDKEPCYPHQFTIESQDGLGGGSYPDVYFVTCRLCNKVCADKTIELPPGTSEVNEMREKQIRNADMQFNRYKSLDHPHIVQCVQYELNQFNMHKLHIYMENCSYGDLEELIKREWRSRAYLEELAWKVLEALASALARCHHGLAASSIDGVLSEYTDFPDGWTTILHRHIRPGNVLNASSGLELVPKLGGFGALFKLEDDGNFPSTRQVGPRSYWAPEIVKEATLCSGRITNWSTKSDIWAAGAVVYWILTGQSPIQDPVRGVLMNSGSILQSLAGSKHDDPASMSTSLGRLIIECLDSSPDDRPSALGLLAVAVKADTSGPGLYKGASFWKALSTHTDREVVSTVTKHFVSTHLPILARRQTAFDPKEIAIIMSLAKVYCPESLRECHGDLCAGPAYKRNRRTVFHALACIGVEDEETIRLAVTDSKWPETEELMHLALQKDKLGLLPSALAASKKNLPLCVSLTSIEDRCRAAISDQLLANRINALHNQHEEELGIVLEQLAAGSGGQLGIPASHAAMMMIGSATRGSSYVVRKLVGHYGIPPSAQDRTRGETVLHKFSARGNLSMISFLLDHGANVGATDRDNRTPLHQAAACGQSEAVQELLNRNADLNAQDRQGRTPLYLATVRMHPDVVRLLLAVGADKSLRGGSNNRTPLEVAISTKQVDVVEMLRDSKGD